MNIIHTAKYNIFVYIYIILYIHIYMFRYIRSHFGSIASRSRHEHDVDIPIHSFGPLPRWRILAHFPYLIAVMDSGLVFPQVHVYSYITSPNCVGPKIATTSPVEFEEDRLQTAQGAASMEMDIWKAFQALASHLLDIANAGFELDFFCCP